MAEAAPDLAGILAAGDPVLGYLGQDADTIAARLAQLVRSAGFLPKL